MNPVKLRDKRAEAEYFRILRRWKAAMKSIDDYDEKSLRFLWQHLESAWRRIGYVIGDESEPMSK